ncbi:MAG TPA: hypothetical protein VL068_04940 [Microthrixaceae bacterium]|nr:hypothetical protein [Microthrixaceae bacterium]
MSIAAEGARLDSKEKVLAGLERERQVRPASFLQAVASIADNGVSAS